MTIQQTILLKQQKIVFVQSIWKPLDTLKISSTALEIDQIDVQKHFYEHNNNTIIPSTSYIKYKNILLKYINVKQYPSTYKKRRYSTTFFQLPTQSGGKYISWYDREIPNVNTFMKSWVPLIRKLMSDFDIERA